MGVCLLHCIAYCVYDIRYSILVYTTKLDNRTLRNEKSLTRPLVAGVASFIIGLLLIGMFTSLNF